MKQLILTLLTVLSITFSQNPVPPSEGDGTEGNPYKIANLDNICWISATSSSWDKYYIQTADINAAGTRNWYSGQGWIPIGQASPNFTGHYDGGGHSIDSLYINRWESRLGLFGYLAGATVKNLNVNNLTIAAGNSSLGGITGGSWSYSLIENCSTSGGISGQYDYFGGIIGSSGYTTIKNCFATVVLNGRGFIGGIVGNVDDGNVVETCLSNSTVYCGYYGNAGGIAGTLSAGSIISKCASLGTTNGGPCVGGIVGFCSGILWDCYAKGGVNGSSTVGGLAGNLYGTINNCFSTGKPTASSELGGLLGKLNGGSVNNCFWDTETSETLVSAGGTGKTTAEMKTLSTYTDAGWDFADIWGMDGVNNDGYAYFQWQFPPPDAPSGVTVVYTSSNPQLSWNAVTGATSYKVYSSEDPYAAFPSGWTLEATVTGLAWTDESAVESKKFYVVVAVN